MELGVNLGIDLGVNLGTSLGIELTYNQKVLHSPEIRYSYVLIIGKSGISHAMEMKH